MMKDFGPGILSIKDTSMVTQIHETACGAAVLVMLAHDRGVALRQEDYASQILTIEEARKLGSERLSGWTAEELVRHTRQAIPTRSWVGGILWEYEFEEALWLATARGSCAMLLVGHWIVVDRWENGRILARDPIGYRLSIDPNRFRALWYERTCTAVVEV